MIKNKLLLALSVTAATCLTACGGGNADQNVVRDLFAVGEVIEGTEDDGPIEGDVSKNDQGEGLTTLLLMAVQRPMAPWYLMRMVVLFTHPLRIFLAPTV